MTAALTVLVVDDNDVDRELVRRLLSEGCVLREASSAAEGLASAEQAPVDCVLLDYRLPDCDGVEVLGRFVELGVPVLMMTSQGSETIAVDAMKRGATDYLIKASLAREPLRRAIRSAVATARLQRDLAESRQQLEAQNRTLGEREGQLRFLLGQLPAITWTTNRDLMFTSAGGAAMKSAGMTPEQLVGAPLVEVAVFSVDPTVMLGAHQRCLGGVSAQYDVQFGEIRFHCHAEPIRDTAGDVVGVIGVGLDVTEAGKLEEQLRQAVKMDALGKLAGGIAHDFNNLLMAIMSFTDLAVAELPAGSAVREDLAEVTLAGERATQLVRQLLMFSRQQPINPKVLSPNDIVRQLAPMVVRLLGEDVKLILDCAPDLWTTRIDPGALEQVLVNLAVNARDAMPRGGRLTIQTSNVTMVGPDPNPQGDPLEEGEYAVLAVTDEGTGIPLELRQRIFEPFFTTKEVGKGTGLGLSTVYGIVRQIGGAVRLYSQPGHGSTFRIYLPRTGASGAPSLPPGAAPLGGTETVLVVEDEPSVRKVAVRSLQQLGYTVLEASGWESALAQVDACEGPIHLLLTDVVMPECDGPELAERIVARRPELRVFFMTGHTERSIRVRRPFPADAIVVEKPLRIGALGRAVRRALGDCEP